MIISAFSLIFTSPRADAPHTTGQCASARLFETTVAGRERQCKGSIRTVPTSGESVIVSSCAV